MRIDEDGNAVRTRMRFVAQAAGYRKHRQLARLLHPSVDLEASLALGGDAVEEVGPPTLQALAAAALRSALAQQLAALAEPLTRAGSAQLGQQQQQQLPPPPRSPLPLQQQQPAAGAAGAAAGPPPARTFKSPRTWLRRGGKQPPSAAAGGAAQQGPDADGTCGVCLDVVVDVASGGCGHTMCGACARQLVARCAGWRGGGGLGGRRRVGGAVAGWGGVAVAG
jgi:hypothetical protein